MRNIAAGNAGVHLVLKKHHSPCWKRGEERGEKETFVGVIDDRKLSQSVEVFFLLHLHPFVWAVWMFEIVTMGYSLFEEVVSKLPQ